jgi:signal transduction histidine kinase
MERIIRSTRTKFVTSIVLVVAFVVATTWGILQIYNQREIATPADIAEVHEAANHSKEFGEYLEDQKEYEAHFITLASSIKEQEAERVTRGLAITAVITIIIGTIAAVLVARRLMKPVVDAYESQERFVQDAAHELRNPLAAMTVALQQAEKAGQKSPLITTFRRQTKRLIHINEDLLFLERRSKQDPVDLNVSELLEDVVEELQPLAIRKHIALQLKTDKDIMKKMASGDYVRLVKNIIDNAVKYSKPKSVVTIHQHKVKGDIKISVEDTGIGIPQKDLENIGDRFFRASNTGKIDGTGLGLAIVQKILNTYGGSKEIVSKPNKGTTVTLTLPS